MAATSDYSVLVSDRMAFRFAEAKTASANTIYPGQIVDLSSGEAIVHNTAADTTIVLRIAVEDQIGGDWDATYVATETCHYAYPTFGALFYGWLETGANVAANVLLEAAGNGALQAVTTGTAIVVTEEAVNNSGGGSGPNGSARIKVRKI